MAENIYSKGTQVWFPDKELSWISGEVTSTTRNPDDTVKLVFQDERGKVSIAYSFLEHVPAEIYSDFRIGNCNQHDSQGD